MYVLCITQLKILHHQQLHDMNHCSAFFMLQYPFNIVMKQKIILFLKTTLTTSFTLLERVFTNLHRTTACLLFLQNLLDLHCYLPHFSSFPPCWKLFPPYVVPADSVSVEEGGKWFVITG